MQEGEAAGLCVAVVVLGGARASCSINSSALPSHLLTRNTGLSCHFATRFTKFEFCMLLIFDITYFFKIISYLSLGTTEEVELKKQKKNT